MSSVFYRGDVSAPRWYARYRDLYAVEAAWDLTPLERAVIEGRRS